MRTRLLLMGKLSFLKVSTLENGKQQQDKNNQKIIPNTRSELCTAVVAAEGESFQILRGLEGSLVAGDTFCYDASRRQCKLQAKAANHETIGLCSMNGREMPETNPVPCKLPPESTFCPARRQKTTSVNGGAEFILSFAAAWWSLSEWRKKWWGGDVELIFPFHI
nr:hypothetical protein Iba_chr05dCG9650 [Ipomoea batatas]